MVLFPRGSRIRPRGRQAGGCQARATAFVGSTRALDPRRAISGAVEDQPAEVGDSPVRMLSVRVPIALHRQVNLRAVVNDSSMQNEVRRAVEAWLRNDDLPSQGEVGYELFTVRHPQDLTIVRPAVHTERRAHETRVDSGRMIEVRFVCT